MSVEIPAELLPFVEAVVSAGQYRNETEVVGEALRLLRDIEARRAALRNDIVAGIESGESRPGEEVFEELLRRAKAN